jgi:hypothetical protein
MHLRSIRRPILFRALTRLAVVLLALAVALPSFAQDVATLRRDVISASDFRVRVAAALALGKKKDAGSVDVLSKALSDESAAVRSGAAAALGAIGDARGLKALESAKKTEKDASVKGAIDRAIATLKGKTKFVVALGKLENKSGNPKLSKAFQSIAKAEISRIPGIAVAGSDDEAVEKAKTLKIPTIALDGQLVQVQKEKAGGDVGFNARVEFIIRKLPEQSLKASVKGKAKALAQATSVKTADQMSQLEQDAVKAAVQSAIASAPKAMEEAAK